MVQILTSGNAEFNLKRLERYIILALESGAAPVIVLTKSDILIDRCNIISQIERVALGIPIYVVSAMTHEGLKEMLGCLGFGRTAALLGSSGVGKSTLANALMGREIQNMTSIRESDDRGRHTTTTRNLFLLPGGGMLIDPVRFESYKELQLEYADVSLKLSGYLQRMAKEKGEKYARLMQLGYSKKRKGRGTLK